MSGDKGRETPLSTTQEVNWAISRMRRLFAIWDNKLHIADKAYCLRRIRDKEPALFYRIAQEK